MGTFDVAYTWSWMHKAEDFYKKYLSIAELDAVLSAYDAIGDESMRAWFTSNHDENSWNGSEYEKYGEMAMTLAVFSCTWNGIPLIYSGQELPNLKRLKFFEKDQINWSDKNHLHDFYKTLLRLHTNNPALKAGDPVSKTIRIKASDPKRVFAYLRKNGGHEVLVFLNLSNTIVSFSVDEQITGTFKEAFSGTENDFLNHKSLVMSGWGYLVFVKL
jgi:glycosidase